MKKIFATLVLALMMTVSFAANKNLQNDITMVSYEQGWLDSKGTLALRNNSNERVKNVSFTITYLDMDGKELDYQEFLYDVDIAPGKTRKIGIPAYEHDRSYHYYKSENRPGGSPAFKIKYQLRDYNLEGVTEEEDSTEVAPSGGISNKDDSVGGFFNSVAMGSEMFFDVILGDILFLFVIGITVGLYVLVAIMAKKRNRSVVLWVLISLIASPLLAIIILLVVGEDDGRNDRHAYRPDDNKERIP